MSNKPKTDAQRAALHVWCRECAHTLNDQGQPQWLAMKKIHDRGIEVAWTEETFKDMFRAIYSTVFSKQSTEDATTTDYNVIYEGMCRWFAQEMGVVLPPWPHKEGHDDGQ
jgi:hypothetical protein